MNRVIQALQSTMPHEPLRLVVTARTFYSGFKPSIDDIRALHVALSAIKEEQAKNINQNRNKNKNERNTISKSNALNVAKTITNPQMWLVFNIQNVMCNVFQFLDITLMFNPPRWSQANSRKYFVAIFKPTLWKYMIYCCVSAEYGYHN